MKILTVKNLKKTYHPKKGVPQVALNGVSLEFDTAGMVFILGKSGSGKSTLLNLLGGLDTADSGEIIIKGKSSGVFSQSEFDSYRNTYVGFIFQEYNLIDEFSVAENVGLALELQNKKAEKEEITTILAEVDLSEYADRKPNELSGGQRQRVAIARALIKNPEIILADEPGGALDAATGKQVFETLKRLSKDRLVLIVTHDRETAEKFGDRIIEFADGKVISDIEKTAAASIKNTENGESSFKLIKSRLPYKTSFRLGASGLKHKPIRLAVAVFLAFVSFALFAVFDTIAAYNMPNVMLNSLIDTGDPVVSIVKTVQVREDYEPDVGMEQSDIDYIKGKYNNYSFVPFYTTAYNRTYSFSSQLFTNNSNDYYPVDISCLSEAIDVSEIDGKMLYGRLPQKAGEVTVSKLIYESFVYYGIDNGGVRQEITEYKDIIGLKLIDFTPQEELEICGIFDHGIEASRFETLKQPDTQQGSVTERAYRNLLRDEWFLLKKYSPLATGIIYPGSYNMPQGSYRFHLSGYGYGYPVQPYSFETNPTDTIYFESGKNSLADNEILVSPRAYASITEDDKGRFMNSVYEKAYIIAANILDSVRDKIQNGETGYIFSNLNAFASWDIFRHETAGEISRRFASQLSVDFFFVDNQPNADAVRELFKNIDYFSLYLECFSDMKVTEHTFSIEDRTTEKNYSLPVKVVGLTLTKTDNFDDDAILYHSDLLKNVYPQTPIVASGVFVKLNLSKSDKSILDFSFNYSDGVRYKMYTSVTYSMEIADDLLKTASGIFIWIALGFALFASLMLINFISVSVSLKKREIGILRALGARGRDVFMIFFNESLLIAFINVILAAITSVVGCAIINSLIRKQTYIVLTMLNFGIRQVLLLIGISVVVAAIATLIPIFHIARKKPVDAMADR